MTSLTPKQGCCSTKADQAVNYNGIDLCKFLCAIMVLIIHVPPFQGEISEGRGYINFFLQEYLCRLAVPFYFISSGFFLFRKMPVDQLDAEVIKGYCFKILRLLGIWSVLLFFGGKGHMWFLGGTVIAVVLVSLCYRFRMRFLYICLLACLLYAIGLLGDSYYGLIVPLEDISLVKYLIKGYSMVFETTRNGVFMGFIFVLMGAAFAHYPIKLKPAVSLVGLAVSLVCLFLEVFFLENKGISADHNMHIFLVPASFFLFAFASSLRLKERPVYKKLRTLNVLVYLTHLLVNQFVLHAIWFVLECFRIDLSPYIFVITLFLTLGLSLSIQWLSEKKHFTWIKWCLS